MLRTLVLVLLLANAGVLAWSAGALEALGQKLGLSLGPWAAHHSGREPERMKQQIQPERIHLLPTLPDGSAPGARPVATVEADSNAPKPDTTTTPAASTPVPTQAPLRCLQAGIFNDRQAVRLRSALETALPGGAWALDTTVQAPRWIVYSGKLVGADAMAAKRTELRQLHVDYRDVSVPALAPGLALGTYSTEAAAQQALRDVQRAGVRGARVAIERPETTLYTLRLPQANEAIQTTVQGLGDALVGKTLQPCP
jgi:hypothetical protein